MSIYYSKGVTCSYSLWVVSRGEGAAPSANDSNVAGAVEGAMSGEIRLGRRRTGKRLVARRQWGKSKTAAPLGAAVVGAEGGWQTQCALAQRYSSPVMALMILKFSTW